MKKLLPGLLIIITSIYGTSVYASSAQEIAIKVDVALERFNSEIQGGKTFLKKAKGVLIFQKS